MLKGDFDKFQRILHRYEERKMKLIDTIACEKAELVSGGRAVLTYEIYMALIWN